MKVFRATVLVFCVALLMGAFTSPVNADEHDKLTIFTFSQPVEIPGGKVLPAGTYAFKLLDSPGDRNIVQIFDKDQMKLYATVMAIPDYRPNQSDKPIITFSETKAGGPVAIKEWFYPSDQYGQEFVYPKDRAVQIAQQANQPVPSQPEQTASNINQPAQSASDQNVKNMEASSLKAEQPSGQEVEVAEVFIVAPAADDGGARTVAHKLPQTASSLPLLSVSGLFLILLGGLFWVVSRRRAS
ncbi:MAG: LPXTG cell wall anchor domain-containing protein [Candidatus Acidiferrales bacterium]